MTVSTQKTSKSTLDLERMRKGNSEFHSTWQYRQNRSKWGFSEWLLHLLDVNPAPPNFSAPVFAKSDTMPRLSEWDLHRWILPRAILPILLHVILQRLGDKAGNSDGGHFLQSKLSSAVLYSIAFQTFGVMTLRMLRTISKESGFLDGESPRDGIPDKSVGKIVTSLLLTSTYRPFLAVAIAYDSSVKPSITLPWIVAYIGLYSVVLDFFFYWYHRAMHEVSWLWHFHSTHHKTKHPNPSLSLYADETQEVFDIIVIPLLAYFFMRSIVPMTFYDWWICSMYQVYIELAGHSGLRVHGTPPQMLGITSLFGLELVLEDHDLHHRRGYRSSGNYGKQTLVWDHLFGTVLPRQECVQGQISREKVSVPW